MYDDRDEDAAELGRWEELVGWLGAVDEDADEAYELLPIFEGGVAPVRALDAAVDAVAVEVWALVPTILRVLLFADWVALKVPPDDWAVVAPLVILDGPRLRVFASISSIWLMLLPL